MCMIQPKLYQTYLTFEKKITNKSFMWYINTENVQPKETLKSSDEMRNRTEISF